MKDKNLKHTIVGIKIALVAIIIMLAAEALSIFLPLANLSPLWIGFIYLVMAGILLYYTLKIKIPK